MNFVAAAYEGDIITSNDGGATWTDRTASGPAHNAIWWAITSDATGMNLAAVIEARGF